MVTYKIPKGFSARGGAAHASQLQDLGRGRYRFTRNRLSVIGLSMVLILIVVAITAPLWVPYPGDVTGDVHMAERLKPPSTAHFFGTDDAGRDVFSRTVMATRVSFQVGIIILVVAISIGVTLGAIAGYFGGWVDEVIMRLTDIMLTFPGIFLALAITAALGRGVGSAVPAPWSPVWPGYWRLGGATMLKLRQGDCGLGAGGDGAGQRRC